MPSSCVSGLPGQGESTYTCTMAKQFCNVDISLYSFVKWSRVVNVPDIHVRAALEYDINILGIVLPCAIECPWQPRFMRVSVVTGIYIFTVADEQLIG